ncbi:LOW QUALITY PROTEIN: tumor necrosis factor alpha-induced protein 8-like protein [Centruroides vittatus]|uniref:LOW QUALITY PROTEIN: tumor necrosis factor alpha-induced protein 8-like protein n=1 Tax=Centruroides vittatus TaxID=120091 RepID=UPI0035105501
MSDNNFKSKDIGFIAQKKLLSRMASKNVAKVFIDDVSGNLLDNVYRLVKNQSGNKKEAEKVVKNIIKIVVKIGVLHRNGQFNSEEIKTAERFKQKFHSTAMAIISFYEVDFSFDKNFLTQSLNNCRSLLKELVVRHLTEKSLNRIDHVFNFFTNPNVLDDVFSLDSNHKELLGKIVADMHKLLEEGSL